MRISENFSRGEFLHSSTAARLGYMFDMNRWEFEQIQRLVVMVLQPARTALGVPFVITSGFRPAWLNRHIRGAADSYHLYGSAADFQTPTMDISEAFRQIQALQLPIDQLILEDPPSGWMHVSITLPGQLPRQQYLTATMTADGHRNYQNVRV